MGRVLNLHALLKLNRKRILCILLFTTFLALLLGFSFGYAMGFEDAIERGMRIISKTDCYTIQKFINEISN